MNNGNLTDWKCKSYYNEKRCHRKCEDATCPGITGGACLSATGISMEAPPKQFLVKKQDETPQIPGVSKLANSSTTKGAYF